MLAMAKLTTLEGLRGVLRQPTKYDGMLDCFKMLVAAETSPERQVSAAILFDKLNTVEAAGFLNAQSVNHESGPFQQAVEMYAWRIRGVKTKPAFISANNSVTEEDFATLD